MELKYSMCRFKSGIILKNKVVLAPAYNNSHLQLLEKLGIEDNHLNASKTFVRAELIPKNYDMTTDVKEWKYVVDQDIVPDWYEEDPEKYEQKFRNEVDNYMKKNTMTILGKSWSVIKKDNKGVYLLLNDILKNSEFGKNNNYRNSYIREELNNSDLCKQLKEKFGDKLIPITTNLLSMDGLKDYGIIDSNQGDILAVPTFDLHRECKEDIINLDKPYWLSTPDSTPSGCSSDFVQYVVSGGGVDCGWYDYVRGVRPFFILSSDIFASLEK